MKYITLFKMDHLQKIRKVRFHLHVKWRSYWTYKNQN